MRLITKRRDTKGWDVEKHGRMVDHAVAPEDEIETVPYEPEREED